ncbi:uncharacterized protein LY89DRAFT_741187 [Mollisia scopiformis]|uniref:Uncharacterized protein n=1 Tax=Mollisia scopiformis TaxID=149040 RepID=A0A132BAN8_MOLSC|nr:uncharacterized protein LY89DRAFT_741187 [Mollisia scopiformis]KUJ09480.1 hypothetical protein LY89DRAFT_741187 [Mollisia scopiformis]
MARILLLAPFLSSAFALLPTCYYPSGVTEPNHVPCNQTITGFSACCDPLDSCSTSGICLGRSGWDYRGSCTDETWDSANCAAKQWPQCITDPSTNDEYDSWTAIWSCSPIGTAQGEQCCGYGNGSSCCDSKFELGVTGPSFKPGYDALIQNLTSGTVNASSIPSQKSNCTNTNTTSTQSCGNGDLGTKVGVGVGIPLGVLVAGLLSFLFYREFKKGKQTKGVAAPVPNHEYYSPMAQQHVPNYTSGYAQNQQPAAYSPNVPKPNPYSPAAAAPVYEAPTANGVHELGGR